VKSKKVPSNLYNFSEKKKILTCGKLQDNLKSIISQIYGSEASSNNVTIKHITQMNDQIVDTNSSQFEFCKCGEWVIVAFENSWYPGEVVDIISTERASVNFMRRIGKSFNWPKKPDQQCVESKFVLMPLPQSLIVPISNGRAFTITNSEKIDEEYYKYCRKFFQ